MLRIAGDYCLCAIVYNSKRLCDVVSAPKDSKCELHSVFSIYWLSKVIVSWCGLDDLSTTSSVVVNLEPFCSVNGYY